MSSRKLAYNALQLHDVAKKNNNIFQFNTDLKDTKQTLN
ncbi:hypothetical protein lillamy97_gp006 [Flavobacterium phage vB_FspS_lillamy9-7]|uniref:Uncharacterized protein n=1 Tax=Flavobacterium phage vB_FspS_lillamy9-7 TaxID=2686257 RepID=A0A6B9LCA1_9CAUD|nr:hypothetical protein lillamy93_gp006 [Flavobacterium phage vB_FspS_lillamy9-3]QHB39470.1 hypothetical protein lillamy97_gp006 [Flavobacterium phage vB_FspS_lillamy9-7]